MKECNVHLCIRIIMSIILLCFVFKETGSATSIFLGLIVLNNEAQAAINKGNTIKILLISETIKKLITKPRGF